MSFCDVDWSQFLLDHSDIPPDVTFRVIERSTREEDDKISLVKAHKFLLAGVSEVFRKQFYGPMKEGEGVIGIKDTTAEAFSTMINFFYSKSGNIKLSQDPKALFDLLNVANKYLAVGLIDKVQNAFEDLKLCRHNVMRDANTARVYSHFEKMSISLTYNCARFLDETFETKEDVYAFLRPSHKSFPGKDTELKLSLLSLNVTCSNCRKKLRECLDGTDVTFTNSFVGLKIACKPTGQYYDERHKGLVTITKKNSASLLLDITPNKYLAFKTSEGKANFIFYCKSGNEGGEKDDDESNDDESDEDEDDYDYY